MSDATQKAVEPYDEEEFLKAWDSMAPTMDSAFSALSGVMGTLKRGIRALAIGIAVALLASHQPYISAPPAGLAVAAGLLSFVNLTKMLSVLIVLVLTALVLTPPPLASLLASWVGRLI